MADDEPLSSGWLPPRAPGSNPPPRFRRPRPEVEPDRPDVAGLPPREDAPSGLPGPEDESVRGWAPPTPARGELGPVEWNPSVAGSWTTPRIRPPESPPAQPALIQAPGAANGLATASLVLGIMGLAVLVITLGLGTLISLPLSIAAWICAHRARGRIKRGETTTGVGSARAGRILAIIGVALGVAALIVWSALEAAGYTIDDLRESIERELERQRSRGS
jgi:hypothetical protein